MSANNISVDGDAALAALKKISTAHASQGLPSSSSISSHGVSIGAASSFSDGLKNYVTGMQTRVDYIRNQLASVHANISETVSDLVERDAALADEAKTFLGAIESIPAPAVVPGAKATTDTAASTSIA